MSREFESLYEKAKSISSDAATAQEYIKNLAIHFTSVADFSEFLGLCDIAQAVLVCCVIDEIKYIRNKQYHYEVYDATESEYQKIGANLFCQYLVSLAEFEIIKDRLRILVNRLDL